jgi:uncharacterized damage-inducible protein DinB
MCPACVASAALAISSVVSTGGLTAAVVNKIRSKSNTKGNVMRLVDSILMEVLDTFSKSLESAKDALKKMDDARLMSMWNLTKNGKVEMSIPRIGFIRSILMNHNYHHRGQLSVYLRILNVPVPSIYGPSADENPFA